jgi:hypothetical protein
MRRFKQDRRGFALPAAVFSLVVVGVLVTGGFYMARQETRIGIAAEKGSEAFYLAERGVNEVLETWNGAVFGALDVQESATVVDTVDQGRYRVEVTKLSDWIYILDSRGVVTEGGPMLNGASRRVGTMAKIRTIDMRPPAALTTVGALTIGGSSQIFGQDSIPGAWGSAGLCDPTLLADAPGVMIDDATAVDYSGSNYSLDGSPALAQDPTLTSEKLLTFGDLAWADLVDLATVKLPDATVISYAEPDSVLAGTRWYCNTANPFNWGHPYNPGSVCGNHFPVVHIQGSAKIQSNDFGQGILLVEGDLEMRGGFTFYGPVVVRGTVRTTGTGGHFFGGLIAANVELETTTVLGDALVQYSSCAVTRALLNNAALAMASPLPQRSWVDLSNLAN